MQEVECQLVTAAPDRKDQQSLSGWRVEGGVNTTTLQQQLNTPAGASGTRVGDGDHVTPRQRLDTHMAMWSAVRPQSLRWLGSRSS